jgi:hypothetical protein
LAEGDTVGLSGVSITLKDQGGATLAQVQGDDLGYFQIPLEKEGRYLLELGRIGLRTLTAPVAVGSREIVEVEIRMAAEAIPLEPLVVTARRPIRAGSLDEYYDRMERNRRRGVGVFITREEVENTPSANTTLLLASTPRLYLQPTDNSDWGVRMRYQGDYCTPDYYLDGLLTSWERLPPLQDIEGVEIYRGWGESVDGYWPSRCGAVYMWRKEDWGRPFGWQGVFIAGGLASLAVALALIF